MMRALYSGVSGLKNHQTRLDVIGNNIANVNTVGFKASRVVFQDLYSQKIGSGSGAGTAMGGENSSQVGLGASLSAIDVLHTRGATQYTGAPLDLAIEGDGFFIVNGNGSEYYTRAGNFALDNAYNLVTAEGYFVQGYSLANPPTVPPSIDYTTMGNIQLSDDYYDVAVDQSGAIWGLDVTTNEKVQIGQLQLAVFSNPSGLDKAGGSMYAVGANSGPPTYTNPGANGTGLLSVNALEMSNVDLAQEFTEMIVTQRGFQACSRIITTTDQILEELVNMKR
ncbi:MAG: flagellar basal-body rod protein FlgF [Bacillota bacterium]